MLLATRLQPGRSWKLSSNTHKHARTHAHCTAKHFSRKYFGGIQLWPIKYYFEEPAVWYVSLSTLYTPYLGCRLQTLRPLEVWLYCVCLCVCVRARTRVCVYVQGCVILFVCSCFYCPLFVFVAVLSLHAHRCRTRTHSTCSTIPTPCARQPSTTW